MWTLAVAVQILAVVPSCIASPAALQARQASVTSSSAAPSPTMLVPPPRYCGVAGYDGSMTKSYFAPLSGTVPENVAACRAHCDTDPNCQTYCVTYNSCIHYNNSMSEPYLLPDTGSLSTFYDKGCTPATTVPVPTSTSTPPIPSPLVCGKIGFDTGKPNAYWYSADLKLGNYAACSNLCKAQAGECKSFAFSPTECFLYNSSVASNFYYAPDTWNQFFDWGCTTLPNPFPNCVDMNHCLQGRICQTNGVNFQQNCNGVVSKSVPVLTTHLFASPATTNEYQRIKGPIYQACTEQCARNPACLSVNMVQPAGDSNVTCTLHGAPGVLGVAAEGPRNRNQVLLRV